MEAPQLNAYTNYYITNYTCGFQNFTLVPPEQPAGDLCTTHSKSWFPGKPDVQPLLTGVHKQGFTCTHAQTHSGKADTRLNTKLAAITEARKKSNLYAAKWSPAYLGPPE